MKEIIDLCLLPLCFLCAELVGVMSITSGAHLQKLVTIGGRNIADFKNICVRDSDQAEGRVVRKPVNVNPGLSVN